MGPNHNTVALAITTEEAMGGEGQGGATTDLGEEGIACDHDGGTQPHGRLVGEAAAHLVRGRGRGRGRVRVRLLLAVAVRDRVGVRVRVALRVRVRVKVS